MKILKGYGFHVQKSVFECLLSSHQLQTLIQRLQKWVNPKEDSVRIYRFPQTSTADVTIIGIGIIHKAVEVEVV